MGVEQAYLDLIDSNIELRKQLKQEEITTIRNKEKIRKLTNDLERCELYIKYLENNLLSREDEIDRLKAEYHSTIHELEKCRDYLELKEEALVAQDNHILRLEDNVSQLKARIAELVHKKISKEKSSNIENMAQPNPDNAILAILGNRQAIANSLHGIRVYLDAGGRPLSPRMAQYFDNIADVLNNINIHSDTVQQGITGYRGLLDHANAQVRLVN